MTGEGEESQGLGVATAPVSLMVEYSGADEFVEDYTNNLAVGGTFVHTTGELAPGTEVFLVLTFPGLLRPINVSGVVRWVSQGTEGDDSGASIEFTGYDEIARARMSSLVDAIIAKNPRVVGHVVRVLIVDDNRHIVELIRDGLTQRGPRSFGRPVAFSFIVAEDGQMALSVLEAEDVDIVLTAADLPRVSGAELIREIKSSPRGDKCSVIAMSSAGTDGSEVKEAGCDLLLSKPLRLRDLVEVVKSALQSG